jgi:hypothetical protein
MYFLADHLLIIASRPDWFFETSAKCPAAFIGYHVDYPKLLARIWFAELSAML